MLAGPREPDGDLPLRPLLAAVKEVPDPVPRFPQRGVRGKPAMALPLGGGAVGKATPASPSPTPPASTTGAAAPPSEQHHAQRPQRLTGGQHGACRACPQ